MIIIELSSILQHDIILNTIQRQTTILTERKLIVSYELALRERTMEHVYNTTPTTTTTTTTTTTNDNDNTTTNNSMACCNSDNIN